MIRSLLAVWFLAEVIAYVLFFMFFSLTTGLLVGLGSVFAGAITLRFGGRHFVTDALQTLSSPDAVMEWRSAPLGLLGAVLLLAPGFLSDAVGLLLVVIAAVGLWRRPVKTAGVRDLELSADEWKRLPDEPPK
jgi:UPF0716 family protein affecting phage T7 exclusion